MTPRRLQIAFSLLVVAFVSALPAVGQPAAMVADIATSGVNPSSPFSLSIPVRLGDALYFFAGDGVHGQELWRSDGTEAGTRMVLDICPGDCNSDWGSLIAVHDGTLVFSADDGVHGRELWRSDGTAGGTWMVRDIHGGPGGSVYFGFNVYDEFYRPAALDGALLFAADDGVHGNELWRTDGTESGTELVVDLVPGAGHDSSYPDDLTRLGDAIYFRAETAATGTELWMTDGTADGTHLVRDIAPGSDGSFPTRLTVAGSRLFFSARTDAEAAMMVEGDSSPGGVVVYTLVLTNLGTFAQLDNPGPEAVDVLPPGLSVLAVHADGGSVSVSSPPVVGPVVRALGAPAEVRWNGSIPGSGQVVITIDARIDPGLPIGTELANQATVRFDGDGSGDNETSAPSDDPGTSDPADPTLLVVGGDSVLAIPALSVGGLLLFGLLMLVGGFAALRS